LPEIPVPSHYLHHAARPESRERRPRSVLLQGPVPQSLCLRIRPDLGLPRKRFPAGTSTTTNALGCAPDIPGLIMVPCRPGRYPASRTAGDGCATCLTAAQEDTGTSAGSSKTIALYHERRPYERRRRTGAWLARYARPDRVGADDRQHPDSGSVPGTSTGPGVRRGNDLTIMQVSATRLADGSCGAGRSAGDATGKGGSSLAGSGTCAGGVADAGWAPAEGPFTWREARGEHAPGTERG